jgi:hypothetical protein
MQEPGGPKFSDLTTEEKTKERMETQLYVARDINGEPNEKELQIIRQLEEELADKEAIIGIAPYGSIDPKGMTDEIGTKRVCADMSGKNGIAINPEPVAINLEMILEDIRQMQYGGTNYFPEQELTALSRIVVGEKVDAYRKAIAAELQKIPKAKQEEAVENIVSSLYRRDAMSWHKRATRMPEITNRELENILLKRKDLWEKRVRKIWRIEK